MATTAVEKPVMDGGESEKNTQPLAVSYLAPEDDNQNCRVNLPMKRRMQNDDEEEERSPSKELAERPNRGLHSHSLWKTSLCSYFRRSSGRGCRHGDTCFYAHGEAELVQRLDHSWDPTSERAKKLLDASDDAVSRLADEDEASVDLSDLNKCLLGLPRKWDSNQLSKFLEDMGVSYKTAKKKKGMPVGFVNFDNAEGIENAIQVLKLNPLKCKKVKVADAVHRSQRKIQKVDSSYNSSLLALDDNTTLGISNVEGISDKTKDIRDVVTPLARMPYEDQLEHKRNLLISTLKRLTRNARKACRDHVSLPTWIVKSAEIGGLPCKLEGILESPLVDGYRNKCEFSIGYSLAGKLTVGFKLGNFRLSNKPDLCKLKKKQNL